MALRKAVKRGADFFEDHRREETFLPTERILESCVLISSSEILRRRRRVRFPPVADLLRPREILDFKMIS